MANLDPNAWYSISETRVDDGKSPLKNTLQTRPEGLRVFSLVPQSWQFFPVDGADDQYMLRSSLHGPSTQLTACHSSDEKDISKTRTCLRTSVSDESQRWQVSSWDDGTFKITSVANGTGYVLDVHPGADVFLSSVVEGVQTSERQVAQHWVFSSRSAINDDEYSTTFAPAATNTPAPASTTNPATTTTGTGSPTGSPETSTPGAGSDDSESLSAGAAAGIAVGATAGLALIGMLLFWLWRRRRRDQQLAGSSAWGSPGAHSVMPHQAAIVAGAAAAGHPHHPPLPPDAYGKQVLPPHQHPAWSHITSPTGKSESQVSYGGDSSPMNGPGAHPAYPMQHGTGAQHLMPVPPGPPGAYGQGAPVNRVYEADGTSSYRPVEMDAASPNGSNSQAADASWNRRF